MTAVISLENAIKHVVLVKMKRLENPATIASFSGTSLADTQANRPPNFWEKQSAGFHSRAARKTVTLSLASMQEDTDDFSKLPEPS